MWRHTTFWSGIWSHYIVDVLQLRFPGLFRGVGFGVINVFSFKPPPIHKGIRRVSEKRREMEHGKATYQKEGIEGVNKQSPWTPKQDWHLTFNTMFRLTIGHLFLLVVLLPSLHVLKRGVCCSVCFSSRDYSWILYLILMIIYLNLNNIHKL